MKPKSKKILCILWIVALLADVVSMIAGNEPTWILVLCPVVCLILSYAEGWYVG